MSIDNEKHYHNPALIAYTKCTSSRLVASLAGAASRPGTLPVTNLNQPGQNIYNSFDY